MGLGPLPAREYDRALNSEVERLLYQIDVVVMDATGLIDSLDEEALNRSPGQGRWSAGQSIEHLNITHRLALPLFKEAIAAGRAAGTLSEGPFSYGFLSRMMLRMVEPPVRLRIKAPAAFQPSERVSGEKLATDFETLHREAQELLRSANGLDLARIRVRSAFSNWVHYNLGMGFWILAAHDRRHIRQAREAAGGR